MKRWLKIIVKRRTGEFIQNQWNNLYNPFFLREVIKECPLALEAVKGLLQMGVSAIEIQVYNLFLVLWNLLYIHFLIF